jgi:hypothetical protein
MKALGSFFDAIRNDSHLGSARVCAQHLPGEKKCHD